MAHSQRVAADALICRFLEADLGENFVNALLGRMTGPGEHAQVIASLAAGMKARGLKHGTDLAEGVLQLRVLLAENRRLPGVGVHQTEQDAQRCRLAGAVRAEEADHPAGLDREREPIHGLRLAVALA